MLKSISLARIYGSESMMALSQYIYTSLGLAQIVFFDDFDSIVDIIV